METFDLLKTLTETAGPSGFEAGIAAVVQEIWRPLVDEVAIDRIGSLSAIKYGHSEAPRPRILLAAHMDELGLMVSQILEHNGQGFLRVSNLGGVDVRQLYNQRVVVHGQRNLPAVLGGLPNHLLQPEHQEKPYSYETLVVDPGLPHAELAALVSVGDAVSFHQPLRKLVNGRVAGKSLDNRASVAAVTYCLKALQTRPHAWDIIAVATAQEETRLLGAATTAFAHQPNIAIAIDVTFGQGPGTSDPGTFPLGDGPVIGFTPDTHPAVADGLRKAAEEMEMKYQSEFVPYPGGTDAYYLQIAREGIPTGLLGIPLRYMHTMVESVAMKDVERVGRLAAEYIASLDSSTIANLTKSMMED